MMKKTLMLICVLFLAFQWSAYAGEVGPIRNPGDALTSYNLGPGLKTDLKIAAEETNHVFQVWETNYDEGYTSPVLEHRKHYRTLFITEGLCELTIGKKAYRAKAGSVVHLLPYTPCKLKTLKPTRILTLITPPDRTEFLEVYKELTPAQQEDKGFMKELSEKHDEFMLEETATGEFRFAETEPVRGPGDAIDRWWTGLELRLLVASYETHGVYEIFSMEVPKGQGFQMHEHHKRYETWFVMDGSIEMGFEDGSTVTVKPGAVIHMPPFTPHAPTQLEDCTILTINYPPDYQIKQHELDAIRTYHPEVMDAPGYQEKEWATYDVFLVE